jgi:hypothetical protein
MEASTVQEKLGDFQAGSMRLPESLILPAIISK